jgi:hypothetical protein
MNHSFIPAICSGLGIALCVSREQLLFILKSTTIDNEYKNGKYYRQDGSLV